MELGWKGDFDIFIKNNNDEEFILDKSIQNMITDVGLNLFRDVLRGVVTSSEITYIAVGTSTASVSSSSVQLGAEFFRKQIFSKSATTTGSVQTIGILDDSDAIGQIEEIGIFGGSTASITANSGVMISRILYSRNKTNLESVQIQRTDTIGRS